MAMIQVKPVDAKKWHGKTGNESFTRPKIIQAFVDAETTMYKTGLTEEEEKKYGELLKVDLSKQFSLDTPHPFWDSKTAEIRLENRTQFFNDNNPLDFVKIKVMKASKFVANSIREWEEGLYPEATHVIFDESEEVDAKAALTEIKNNAIIATSKISKDAKIDLIMVLSADDDYLKMKNLKGKSDSYITVEMEKIIDKKAEQVLKYLKMDREYISLYALSLEALQKHVLTKEGHKIKYHESVIAQDIESLIDYLGKPENQELKLRIIANINK